MFAVVCAAALSARADEAATLKWVSDEHMKLLGVARKDGLFEEELEETALSGRARSWADPSAKHAADISNRVWMTRWDDALHRKYLAFAEKRKTMRKTAAGKFAALGKELKAADPEKAAHAWRMALVYDRENKEAHEGLGEAFVEKQGWFPKEDAEKRKKGLLPIGGEWLPAKEVEKRRSNWAEAWVVSGEHFEVTSNHSLAGAQDVLARAEEMYRAMIRELHGLAEPPVTDGLMKIYYFASRADLDEHNRTAHGDRPGLKQAPGFFSNEDRVGHFFPLPANAQNTLQDVVRHEGAHEVAFYLWKASGTPPTRPHFWAWEGWATYFESVENRDGKIVVGNPNHLRVKQARDNPGAMVPLEEFVQLDQRGVSGKYAQCAALTHFFMNARDGEYRARFVEYVKVVHEAKAEADTFSKAMGRKPGEFQAEWDAYLGSLK